MLYGDKIEYKNHIKTAGFSLNIYITVNFKLMKSISRAVVLIILTGCVGITSCKKEKIVAPPIISPPSSNSELVPLGTLSIARKYVCAATAGSKVLFAGGAIQLEPSLIASSRVDIYDTSTHSWSTAELSMPRAGLIATSLGSKIYFVDAYFNNSSRIDIYDASNNSWSTAELSVGRNLLAAGSATNKIVYAGGLGAYADKANIFDMSANTWSSVILDEPRAGISATSIDNKIFFSGGIRTSGDLSDKVDVYDAVSNVWSTTTMSEPRYYHTSIATANQLFWAGGYSSFDSDGELIANNSVEIHNITTGGRIHHQLTHNPFYTAIINNSILFFSAFYGISYSIDVYDINTPRWSVRNISFPVQTAIGWPGSIAGLGNKIFIAAGLNGSNTSTIWKLEF